MVVLVSADDSLPQAWAALLRGDTAERDRICAIAEKGLQREEMDEEARAVAKVLSIDFYVKADGTAISTRRMYAAAN